MSKIFRRRNHRAFFDRFLTSYNLPLSRCEKLFAKVVRSGADSLPLEDKNRLDGLTDPKIAFDDSRLARTNSSERRSDLKRLRNDRKKNNYNAKSKKRRKVLKRSRFESREDSSGSSDSSSDLHRTPKNTNRNISSRLVQYTFYSVVNTGVAMDQGATAAALCRSFLALYLKLDESSVYSTLLDAWDKVGQNIIILKGYNHKHLQYLAKEVRHIAVESNTLYKRTGDTRVMLVLTAFGREEDMEEAFDDLCYLH